MTAFVSVPTRWEALTHHDWISSGISSMVKIPAENTCTSITHTFPPTPAPPPALFLSFAARQVFLSTDAHFSPRAVVFFSPLSFSLSLSLSHSSPLPPPPVLCVRVCRWPSLAGSVTRGNWGRVHFHRTNGNKLICFHCCVFETVF